MTGHPSLEQVRNRIDAIDNAIQDLLIQRTQLVEEVRRIKHDWPIKIQPAREAEIVHRLLDRLNVPYCLASSSAVRRINAALAFAGLADRFIGKVFSASMVSRGKPAPDLFLHVAKVMGVEPRDCLVIEDSPAGVEAARRANMAVIGFVGGSHADSLSLRATLTALGPDAICSGFDEVLDLVAG